MLDPPFPRFCENLRIEIGLAHVAFRMAVDKHPAEALYVQTAVALADIRCPSAQTHNTLHV